MDSSVTVVIRSVGERTEKLCYKLMSEQVKPNQIHVVNRVPFTESLRESFRIGLSEDRKWTLCIDADVLIRSGVIESIMEHGNNAKDNVCELQGMIIDKFFSRIRPSGIHLYRTSLLNKAIAEVPKDNNVMRPEHRTLQQMKSDGYPWVQLKLIVGLHDYEQYYSDIFRKFYVQAHKHEKWVFQMLDHWRMKANDDFDYQVALWGLAAGISTISGVQIDKSNAPYHIMEYFGANDSNKFIEKKPIEEDKWNASEIDKMVEEFVSTHQKKQAKRNTFKYNIFQAYKKVGLLKVMPYLTAIFILKYVKLIKDRLSS